MTSGPRVVLDTNVLFPPTLRDTFLYAADAGLFEPLWSRETLTELRRNLIAKTGIGAARADRRILHMTLAFPDATVDESGQNAPALPDPGDRHVLAAALAAGATLVVTGNIRHFPEAVLASVGLSVQTPDAFLCDLFLRRPEEMADAIRFHASLLRHPPTTAAGLLERLSLHAPAFARLARAAFVEVPPGESAI